MPTNCPPSHIRGAQRRAAAGLESWAIVGPTGSGKSSLAMALAQAEDAEIVACDSVQVYRGFDIGAAKPTVADRRQVPHHLLDVVAPDAPFDAQMYCDAAVCALDGIARRGRRAIVCGGTGLYLRALRYGLAPTVAANVALRDEVMAHEATAPGTLWKRLHAVDPASAARIGTHNKVQLLRALEITLGAGEPASAIRARHQHQRSARPMRLMQPVWPVAALRQRVATRVHAMLAAGWVAEVEKLRRATSGSARALSAVGYREVMAHLEGRLSLQALPDAIFKSTWAYVRRQRTWLRREADVVDFPMAGDETDVPRAAALLAAPLKP